MLPKVESIDAVRRRGARAVLTVLGLAVILMSGLGVAGAQALTDGLIRYAVLDYAGALDILKPLARGGDADAQLQIGVMYARGEGVARDPGEAATWLARAAERGKVDAQVALGIMYRDGDGVAADQALALRWLLRAAEQDSLEAVDAIAELALQHFDPARDPSEAVAWLSRAGRLGSAKALYSLGMLYAQGRSVPQDAVEAYKWFALSAGIGLGGERDAASRALVALRERMTPLQVAWGQRSAESWVHGHVLVSQAPHSKGEDVP